MRDPHETEGGGIAQIPSSREVFGWRRWVVQRSRFDRRLELWQVTPLHLALKTVTPQLRQQFAGCGLILSDTTHHGIGPSPGDALHERFASALAPHDLVGGRVRFPGVVKGKVQDNRTIQEGMTKLGSNSFRAFA